MLEGLTDVEVQTLEAELLEAIPLNRSVGNVTLLRTLADKGWTDGRYWAIRDRLIARGTLTTGRGRGGSVMRVASFVPHAVPKQTVNVISHGLTPSDGIVIEQPIAAGGRILTVVQGRPSSAEIEELRHQLMICFANAEAEDGEQLSEVDVGSASSFESLVDSSGEPGTGVQEAQEQEASAADLAQSESVLVPSRRSCRDEGIESLVSGIIRSIIPFRDGARAPATAIIVARYGLGGDDEQTLDAVGRQYDITRERVRQVEAKAIGRLQNLPDLVQQARELLSAWVRRLVEGSAVAGSLLTSRQVESLTDDRSVFDGWIKLALDVAFPVEGAQKRVRQLKALADHALHKYPLFSMDCWVTDLEKAQAAYPIIEEWLEELVEGEQSLPLPANTFATLLGASVADVLTVVSAHPEFTVYAGYVLRKGEGLTLKRRAIRAHILVEHLVPDSAPISQFTLWHEYRQRFEDVDSCSSNDLRIAASDSHGAPHLFVLDNNNSLFALGASSAQHGLNLTPRFPAPAPETLGGASGQLMDALLSGPATAEALTKDIDMSLESAISLLGQRPNVVSITPRYYGMAELTTAPEEIDWRAMDLVKEDALEIIGCRLAGETPAEVYLGWTPSFEMALCEEAERSAWDCLPQLLWACDPQAWPLPAHEQSRWHERKATLAKPPEAISLPAGYRLPDPVRMLRFLLVIRQKGAISAVMANRVTRPRGVLQQVNGTLLAVLARVGALQQEADTWWAKHQAGTEAPRWYAVLVDEYLQYGKLVWTKGACLEMVQEAVDNPGSGWASGPEWTQRIRSWATEVGVVFRAPEATAADAIESDEAHGAAAAGDDLDVSKDFVDEIAATEALADEAVGTAVDEVAEVAELISDASVDVIPSGAAPPETLSPVSAIDSIASLVARAQAGDPDAQYQLAKQLQAGVGAAPNMQAAQYWLERAVHAGHVPACVRLGRLLLTGELGDGSRETRQQALMYLNAGTKAGNATACYLVALAYRDGGLMRKNPQAAMRLLKRAERAGHGRAAYELAVMLRERMHDWVPDTLRLLDQAVEKGVPEAIRLREAIV